MSTPAVAPLAVPAQSTDNDLSDLKLLPLGLFGLAHIVLAAAMHALPIVGTLHAVAVLGIGVVVAARRPLKDAAVVVAYITGAELLWRMTHAGVFWEFGKYAVSIVLLVALARMRATRNRVLAIGYLLLLVPAVTLTFMGRDLDIARKYVSFNLSGPLALCVCVLYFSNVKLAAKDIRRVFVALIGPVLGISTLTYLSTTATERIEFTNASNAATSGGFSATQVSPVLGLALLFCMLLLFERRLTWRLRAPLIVLALLFAVQAALTFSRGGLALAFAATVASSLYFVRNSRTRVTLLVVGVLFFSVGKYVVVPRLETFTNGKFGQRYSSADSSGRNLLASYDIEIFKENPLIGVGPGMATPIREEMGHGGSAHTEFTRMLSEHGLLGAIALLFLLALLIRTWMGARTWRAKTMTTAMLVWVVLFFAIYAMRIAAPSFLFGLACALSGSSSPKSSDVLRNRRDGRALDGRVAKGTTSPPAEPSAATSTA